jgi:hypothetical protein
MLIGLLVLPVGLVYSMSNHEGMQAKHSAYVELSCLLFGAGAFLLGRFLEKKQSRS